MNPRERFSAIWDYGHVDRIPIYYFGVWTETWRRWTQEAGLPTGGPGPWLDIPAATGMDVDWEAGMWNAHRMADVSPRSDDPEQILEEGASYRIIRNRLGAVLKVLKDSTSIPQHIQPALEGTRESWNRFRKFIDLDVSARLAPDWQATAARLDASARVRTLMSTLFAWPREWMGLEGISLLAYDDPSLYQEIIDHLAEYFMRLYEPILRQCRFDFAYFFEDCCGRNGPLFSPDTWRRFYDRPYRRMIDFFRGHGVKHILLDSDGFVEPMIPCWLDTGIDILFPIEVGTWGADPRRLRRTFGKALRMFGGVNKHVLAHGRQAVREHLLPLRELVSEGGYLPIPDHRIGPDVSLQQFRDYVNIFKEVFGIVGA